jgi:hypothetical protein
MRSSIPFEEARASSRQEGLVLRSRSGAPRRPSCSGPSRTAPRRAGRTAGFAQSNQASVSRPGRMSCLSGAGTEAVDHVARAQREHDRLVPARPARRARQVVALPQRRRRRVEHVPVELAGPDLAKRRRGLPSAPRGMLFENSSPPRVRSAPAPARRGSRRHERPRSRAVYRERCACRRRPARCARRSGQEADRAGRRRHDPLDLAEETVDLAPSVATFSGIFSRARARRRSSTRRARRVRRAWRRGRASPAYSARTESERTMHQRPEIPSLSTAPRPRPCLAMPGIGVPLMPA